MLSLAGGESQPLTELNFYSPFDCWIAVDFSLTATDVGVNRLTASYTPCNTPEPFNALGR